LGLQVSAAACVRQGPIRQDQVRVHWWGAFKLMLTVGGLTDSVSFWTIELDIVFQFQWLSAWHQLKLWPDSVDLVCRRNYSSQLQPVQGRDLPDRIWLGRTHLLLWGSCAWMIQFEHAAGATTSLNCSLCKAGTYQTGSGQGSNMLLKGLEIFNLLLTDARLWLLITKFP
jgi:hypothetical protein